MATTEEFGSLVDAVKFIVQTRVWSFDKDPNLIHSHMLEHKIIPDVVDDFMPETYVGARFGKGYRHEPKFGEKLTPEQATNQPAVGYDAPHKETYYTLAMTDPDAPGGEWLHWLVGNIKGVHLETGEILAQYIGPAPQKGTGEHRYVLMLYKQSTMRSFKKKVIPADSTEGRSGWNSREWMKKHELTPVGCLMFKSEYDPYVDTIYERLGSAKNV